MFVILLLAGMICGESQMSAKAKAAFAFANISTDCQCGCEQTGKCTCKNCNEGNPSANCVCGCVTTGSCICKDCNHPEKLDAVYAKAIKDEQIVVLEVGNVPHLTNTPWRVVQVKEIAGEKSGYIVGVPKNNSLYRLDFGPNTTRDRIRLDALHVIYPLTPGYQECPTCPQGRIKTSYIQPAVCTT